MSDTYGTIELESGNRFIWMSSKDGEINGFVERSNGGIIKGTSGWYRTNDPDQAARTAELKLKSMEV